MGGDVHCMSLLILFLKGVTQYEIIQNAEARRILYL